MSDEFTNPYRQPSDDMGAADARDYEETIVSLLREALLPSSGPTIFLRSIERRGERPDTEIIFHFEDSRKGGRYAVRAAPWRERWSIRGPVRRGDRLYDAASVGGWIYSAWMADELEAVEPSDARVND